MNLKILNRFFYANGQKKILFYGQTIMEQRENLIRYFSPLKLQLENSEYHQSIAICMHRMAACFMESTNEK